MAAVVSPRSELPHSLHQSSYSPSASPRIRPSDSIGRERHSSSSSIHQQQQQQQAYRQSWTSDRSGNRPRSVSSSGGVTLKDQAERPSYDRSPSTSSAVTAPTRKPLEPSSAVNMGAWEAPKRGEVGRMRRPASDQDLDSQRGGKGSAFGQQPQQGYQQYQSQQQQSYFPPPQQPWAAPPMRSGSPSGSFSGGTPIYYPQYSPQIPLPPQIQQLTPLQQQAYIQAINTHQFQNNQAGIAAWTSAYQGMLMAAHQGNNANGVPPGLGHPAQSGGMPRSASTPSVTGLMGKDEEQYRLHYPQLGQQQQEPQEQLRSVSNSSSNPGSTTSGPGFHPYRRQPSKQNVAKEKEKDKKRENGSVVTSSSRSSASVAAYPEADEMHRPNVPFARPDSRSSSVDNGRPRVRHGSSASMDGAPAAKITTASRKPVPDAYNTAQNGHSRMNDSSEQTPTRRNMHKRQNSSTSSVGEVIKPTLMHASGSLAIEPVTTSASAHGSELNPTTREWKPSPLAQAPSAPSESFRPSGGRSVSDTLKKDDKKEKGGLRGKLQKAMKRDVEPVKMTPKSPVQQARPVVTPSTSAPATLHQAHDSIASTSTTTRSTSPPITPPQPTPATLGNRRPSNSSFAPSFIEPLDGRGGKPKRSLFNMRNASTDNISISSTVSSASMMIRKMGGLAKIARRNSLAGISKIFKDKDTEDGKIVDEPKDKKKKEKKFRFGSKAAPSNTTTSHATAEASGQDRALDGLSPAAQLARQHTLRTKPEQKERELPAPPDMSQDPYDSDDASVADDDVTLRMDNLQVADGYRPSIDNSGEWDENGLEWGQTDVDRHAIPSKGILKSISSYSEDAELKTPGAPWTRARSNSTEISTQQSKPGPLARITPDQTHIDGPRPSEAMDPFSPSFDPFESGGDKGQNPDRLNLYANASLNSSAPLLSLNNQAGRAQRSATSPMPRKRLNWAPECAIYHTFHATEYDRRSEPATCNRLTPALAQEIKDELNGFKMEEMAVHPSSRVHTQFFV